MQCQAAEPAPTSCTFDVLHDDALAYVLSLLPAEELDACETKLNSSRIYNIVAEKQLWLSLCSKASFKLDTRVAGVDIEALRRMLMHRAKSGEHRAQLLQDRDRGILSISALLSEAELWTECSPPCPSYSRLATTSVVRLRSMLYKEIYRRLSAKPANESLIADAISSSSTGHLFGQLEGTLAPVPLSYNWVPPEDHSNWFWLSGGSGRPDVVHKLCYRMAHDVCVVHSISLKVLEARFHQGNPVYAPASVTFLLAAATHQAASARVGPFQVELAGGNQRHPGTKQFHTGISYIRANGTPMYNFGLVKVKIANACSCHGQASMCADAPNDICASDTCTHASSNSDVATASAMANQPQPVGLRYIKYDSLVQSGGLRAVSERGRLLTEDRRTRHGSWSVMSESSEDWDISDFERYPSEDL